MRLGIPISPDTVLRKIDRNDVAATNAPKQTVLILFRL
jgi:hypothetical protein